MRWSIIISCLFIGACSGGGGGGGTSDPQPSNDPVTPAADPAAPDGQDTGVASEGDAAVAPELDSEAPTVDSGTTEPTDAGAADTSVAKPPPADSGVATDSHVAADTHVPDTSKPVVTDSGAATDTHVATDSHVAADTAVAPDTHVATDTAVAPDTHVATDTYVAPTDTGAAVDTAPADTGSSVAPTYVTHEVTFYGWPDNDPPGPGIAYPKIHSQAGGTGTYADPITFATDATEFPAGTILYVPFIKKYVIMEDYCAQCITDWKAGKRHIDIWMNSDNNNGSKLLACQYSWTRPSVDVEIHPPPDRPVTTTPLFNTSTAVCLTSP